MDILIDTQILVWSFDIYSPLSKQHKKLIEDVSNRILVSQISLMELAIKKNINKLPDFIPDIDQVIGQLVNNGFEILRVSEKHIATYQYLPLIDNHKDPFDRFLIATAQSEKIPIVTDDQKFKQYSALITLI